VQAGDTLVEIAEQFGVSVQALVQTNAIANPNRIQPGDLLTIPAP
jgi:LysM repeat protein